MYFILLFSFLFFFFIVSCSFYHSSDIFVLEHRVLLYIPCMKFLVQILFLFQFFQNTSLVLNYLQ